MRRVLHIVTRPGEPLVSELVARQQAQPDLAVEVVDLTAPEPDYQALLEKLFSADSTQVW